MIVFVCFASSGVETLAGSGGRESTILEECGSSKMLQLWLLIVPSVLHSIVSLGRADIEILYFQGKVTGWSLFT